MSRFLLVAFIASILMVPALLVGQSPVPTSPSASVPSAPRILPRSATLASPSPPAKPTEQELVDSLSPADLQAIISLLKSNFTTPNAITETELSRATVEGLVVRMSRGVMLFPDKESAAAESPLPFYSEVLGGHIGYLRLGSLNSANLQAMDKSVSGFAAKKVDALIIDLRSSGATSDFAMAADFAKRFCPKGRPLFTLRKPNVRQDRVFNSDRDPAFQGLVMVLADGDTAGAAEPLVAALRFYDKALVIGQPTAGHAAEYSDFSLSGGKVLRVAVAEAVSPESRPLFPEGVKPDLPVEMPMAAKRQIFQLSNEKGMGPFVYETGRPHMNEAALLAGTNPEVEAVEAAQQRRGRGPEKPPTHDPVLQRALDVVTSLEVYQRR